MYRFPIGRPTGCPDCYGKGYTFTQHEGDEEDDLTEVFCKCAAGKVRMLVERDGLGWDEACVHVTGRDRRVG